jgi:hypothetical protein
VRLGVVSFLLATLGALLALAPGAAAATRECNGLQICVPVAGPWVVVPTGAAPAPKVEYQLDCPRGYIVGGLDAELSLRDIDISFAGGLGSPVNPGITTTSSAIFSAVYTGLDARAAASVRPHIGCIPASGGGGRVPTAVPVFPPGRPTERRVRMDRIRPGAVRITNACAADEHLIAASHAIGFFTQAPPSARLLAAVRTARVAHGSRVTVSLRAGAPLAGVRAVIQVSVVCAGGK